MNHAAKHKARGAGTICLWTENTVFLRFHKNYAPPSSAVPEAFLQSGEHLIVIWASLYCYHDKNTVLGPGGSLKKPREV